MTNRIFQLAEIDLSSADVTTEDEVSWVSYNGTAWMHRELIPDLLEGEDELETRGIDFTFTIRFENFPKQHDAFFVEFPNGLKGTGLEYAEELAMTCIEYGIDRKSKAWMNCNVDLEDILEDAYGRLGWEVKEHYRF
jgi:hypothetical protein